MEKIRELYELHKETIFRYFYRMTGDEEEAGDLTQETFYQACLSFYRFRNDSSLKTWLFSIARNVYLKNLRDQKSHKTISWEENMDLNCSELSEADNPQELLIFKEERGMIRKALVELSETFRTILILREYEGFSYEEIACVFGQTVNWARVNFFRAKGQLGERYRELGGEDGK
ncbi:RNA polymerase sigma factor [Dehalobacterium formicoaceticum]|uniref:RNA polymerase sigma factor n=1 Tax=Dehalobacterium formicoaceticum TaxID=51515 RepID=A0ABT1Y6A8_9FIRM|nr:RNA polymerase sigma factor [Dehalobacterium formicoaceticum]MCR6546426.1 RNA polymerase sigma factor [Dehalobacterium formicoaceticum]